ncbi:MAG: HD domain-containing protein [Leptolyngbyaceae bacterium]|nr:HD domain-containing protein [Leptolyngbyaceae bacterium]
MAVHSPTIQNPTVQTILDLFKTKGHEQYGSEAVSQLEHALQCATLAEAADSPASLVSACLLHDVGHLIHSLGEDVAERGIDDRHEYRARPFLQKLFGPEVVEPIRLHVNAKRYLCAVDSGYWETLSPPSKRSLELQGGIFSTHEAEAFIQQPHAPDAVRLREWDDLAKVPHLKTPPLEHFKNYLEACVIS